MSVQLRGSLGAKPIKYPSRHLGRLLELRDEYCEEELAGSIAVQCQRAHVIFKISQTSLIYLGVKHCS